MALRLFADHCVPASVTRALAEGGHTVLRLRDHLHTDAPDEAVAAHALTLDALLLTLDGDFADLVAFPPERFHGIVALQVRGRPETVPALTRRLTAYLAAHTDPEHYIGRLFLVEPHRIRVRG